MKWAVGIILAATALLVNGEYLFSILLGLNVVAWWPALWTRDSEERWDRPIRFVLTKEDGEKVKEEAKVVLAALHAADSPPKHLDSDWCPACKGTCRFTGIRDLGP